VTSQQIMERIEALQRKRHILDVQITEIDQELDDLSEQLLEVVCQEGAA
jgi:hypothetical protein